MLDSWGKRVATAPAEEFAFALLVAEKVLAA
jgi:hypothetical protein